MQLLEFTIAHFQVVFTYFFLHVKLFYSIFGRNFLVGLELYSFEKFYDTARKD